MAPPPPSYITFKAFIIYIIIFTINTYILRGALHVYYKKYKRIYRYPYPLNKYHYILLSLITLLFTCVTINWLYNSHLTFLYLLPVSSLDITYETIPFRNLHTPLTIIHVSDLHYS